jgi:hypothetical protein
MNRRHALTRPARRRAARSWLMYALAVLYGLSATVVASADQYDVEVIVFRNLAPRDDGEQWPADAGDDAGGFASVPLQQGVEELPESQFTLNDVAGALQRSGAYRVLAHRLWRETAYDSKSAVPYELYTTQGGSRTLEGSIKLIRERYLHLDIDLTLSASGSLYRLDEMRRIRSGELHYFDNPHFGVIARVTPYGAVETPPEDAAGDGGSSAVPDEESDTGAQPPAQAPER